MPEIDGKNGDHRGHVNFVDSGDFSDMTLSCPRTVGGTDTTPESAVQLPPPPPPPPKDDVASAIPTSPPSTPKYQAKDLHGNLMRELKHRDPLFNYEIVQVLGTGSMGSVAKVRKRSSAIGGSARRGLQRQFSREKRLRECASIPVLGSIFKHCLGLFWNAPGHANAVDVVDDGVALNRSSASSTTSSILNRETNSAVQSYEQDENGKYQLVYAMKSIHLSRVLDPTFVEELRNEVRILRTIDHPHIVRPMETYEYRNQIFIVMELCSGGDLYSRDPYTEAEAARIVSSILSAISYMHGKSICHRDLSEYHFVASHRRCVRDSMTFITFICGAFATSSHTPSHSMVFFFFSSRHRIRKYHVYERRSKS